MIFSLTACTGTSDSGNSAGTTEKNNEINESNELSMDDIVWSVDEGIVDGERYVLMSYTNNTSFTISGIEITFTEKNAVTDEEKETYYSELKTDFDFTDEDLEDIKGQPISMHTESDKIVAAGESASNINCYYYGGFYYVKDINHYNLVEPDIATIRYINNENIYTINYDFKSDKYTVDDETVKAYQWASTSLGDRIPKPDVQVIESGRDDEMIFMFDAYGMSLEQFNAYVEECKTMGYTVDAGSFEGFYSADDAEGYNVYLSYNEDNDSMSGTVEAPENASTETTEPTTSEVDETGVSDASANGLRPEFKDAMDSYEAFFDEYVTFMNKYAKSDGSDLTLLSDYTSYMSKYADMMADFEQWENEEMNTEETAYYIEVQSRINQKLLEVVQ